MELIIFHIIVSTLLAPAPLPVSVTPHAFVFTAVDIKGLERGPQWGGELRPSTWRSWGDPK